MPGRFESKRGIKTPILLFLALILAFPADAAFIDDLTFFAGFSDRSAGSRGNRISADYIHRRFVSLFPDGVVRQRFGLPVMQGKKGELRLGARSYSIYPLFANALTPQVVSGRTGSLVYGGRGSLKELDQIPVAGSFLLLEMDSGKNWQYAAELGAAGVIYLGDEDLLKSFFEEKMELTPLVFPRFFMDRKEAADLLVVKRPGVISDKVTLFAEAGWKESLVENILCRIEGSDPEKRDEVVIIEAFYDSTPHVLGRSPGADEAVSIATLLDLAAFFKENPPERSVVLVATNGHASACAGMRELFWAVVTKEKKIKKKRDELKKRVAEKEYIISALSRVEKSPEKDPALIRDPLVGRALAERLKTEIDTVSRRLVRLRIHKDAAARQGEIKSLAKKRLKLRRILWQVVSGGLSPGDMRTISDIFPEVIKDQERILKDTRLRLLVIKGALDARALIGPKKIAVSVSLHLSSHGEKIGAFNRGFLYPVRENATRISFFAGLDRAFKDAAEKAGKERGMPGFFADTLRPDLETGIQDHLPDKPNLGGEVSALAGYLGVTLATTRDARLFWGTPGDLLKRVDVDYAAAQSRFICSLLGHLVSGSIKGKKRLKSGFATLYGNAAFLRQGELFADQPAGGCIIMGYQGKSRYYAVTDAAGNFTIKGIADKKHVRGKLILEGFKFDPVNGAAVWAIDKKQTGKAAYRLKIRRRETGTRLVMFACRQTTLFGLLEPRTFNYMTKIRLFDARRDSLPDRYWYSRIDTRESSLATLFLEPGTRFKMTLSDSVVNKKLILLNSDSDHPAGTGFLIGKPEKILRTCYQAAHDMWALLGPRIDILKAHGIHNERIERLAKEGRRAEKEAAEALAGMRYSNFFASAKESWALAARVYSHLENVQKDVLFGVLFYIALFLPFAFFAERFFFSFTDIYGRLLAFFAILILLILVIYNVHPAFKLTYSPMVVILAFFIIGLSALVSLIIYMRFETEMMILRGRSQRVAEEKSGLWRSYAAAFSLGVGNLKRRRVRTVLTCMTLVILTFTIMSFTTIKSTRLNTVLKFSDRASYRGFLLKNVNWKSLPPEALGDVENLFFSGQRVAGRAWIETRERTRPINIHVTGDGTGFFARGLIGLSPAEKEVSGIDRTLVAGRWFNEQDKETVILSKRMADHLGILSPGETVNFWGHRFEVIGIFSEKELEHMRDLDDEPLTPVVFPHEASAALTEVEVEALESGEDIRSFQSRYRHIPAGLVIIAPFKFVMAAGGEIKSLAAGRIYSNDFKRMAQRLTDRFGIPVFAGSKDGVHIYHGGEAIRLSGLPNLMIPMVLAVLIVLNTMISSVHERKSEIGIYTSVGLAPSHVSFVFVAEALSMAVISVVLGYLFAQTSAKILSGTSLWAGITVNYSSLSGVAAMALVIMATLASVVYPSRLASMIAIPDVSRTWSLPPARGEVLEVRLPFMMRQSELLSISGCLYDYLAQHQDIPQGAFSSDDVVLLGEEQNERLTVSASVWLAPFDFGVKQKVEIDFILSPEEPGYFEIMVRIRRVAGEQGVWHRGNRAFLFRLRHRLLAWRSLNDEAHREFARVAEKILKKMVQDR